MTMNGWTVCPGCRLQLPTEDRARDHRVDASAECLHLYGEVVGFATQHPPLMRLHQLTVDAYGAQHGGGGTPPIRLAFSLVGLYLALEQKFTGPQVRAAHQRMGKPDASWPMFAPPEDLGSLTVMTVAERGLMRDSESGHLQAAAAWAQSVWRTWVTQHQDVIELTKRLFPDLACR